MNKRKSFFCGLLIIALCFLILIGCGEEESDVAPINSPPVISELVVPDRLKSHEIVTLQAVSHDFEDDALSTVWEASDGTIIGNIWTPPDRTVKVEMVAHVSDGINPAAEKSKTVLVIRAADIVPGRIIPGVSIGEVELWITHEEAKEVLDVDRADSIGEIGTARSFYYESVGLDFLISKEDRVIRILMVEPNTSSTRSGLTLGSTRAEVEAEFGEPPDVYGEERFLRCGYGTEVEIAFYYRFGIVDGIEVYIAAEGDKL